MMVVRSTAYYKQNQNVHKNMAIECSDIGFLLWRMQLERLNFVHNEVGSRQHARSPAEQRLTFPVHMGNG